VISKTPQNDKQAALTFAMLVGMLGAVVVGGNFLVEKVGARRRRGRPARWRRELEMRRRRAFRV